MWRCSLLPCLLHSVVIVIPSLPAPKMMKMRTLTRPIKCKPLPGDLEPAHRFHCPLPSRWSGEACLPSGCTNDSKDPHPSLGPLVVLVFSAFWMGTARLVRPCGHPISPCNCSLPFFFMFPQVKTSLPATFAQHASSPSTAPGFCCSMRRTHTASASTWSPGRPAPRSRPGSPSRRRSGRRPWHSPHS